MSERWEMRGLERIDLDYGIPRARYMINEKVPGYSPEEAALSYLERHSDELIPGADPDEIQVRKVRETPGGYRVRLNQFYQGIPVYRGDITVSLDQDLNVVMVMNGYRAGLRQVPMMPRTSAQAAISDAKAHIGLPRDEGRAEAKLMIFQKDHRAHLVYRVFLTNRSEFIGECEFLIDARNGEILKAEDIALYETGYGTVFDPDPVTRAQTVGGNGGFVDNNDSDHPDLTAQLVNVELTDIFYSGGQYYLENDYAAISDLEGPYHGDFSQNSDNFQATRSQDLFEAVNVFHHLDHSMRYLNDELGFNCWPYQYEGGVQFDPHGLNGDLNAHYSWDGYVAFGSPNGNVDLGEDHAVILHELGHGIHHWITDGGLSQEDGLSEGCADFWAQTYTRSLGFFQPEDEQFDWFSVWGFQPYLRVTNYNGHYPEALNGSVHHDGQLWSSSLMSIWNEIGKEATDRVYLEGISMTNGNSNQVDAAWAFIQADMLLYDGEHLQTAGEVFADRGYIDGTMFINFTADETGGAPGRTIQFTDMSFALPGPIISYEWDFDGDGVTDSTEENPTWTVDAPGFYTISLTVSDGLETETLTKIDFISVNEGVMIWEGPEGGSGHSGEFIEDQLLSMNIVPHFSRSENLPSTLAGFDAVFMSLGNSGDDSITRLTNDLAAVVEDYLVSGGKLYLDGGEPLGWDQRQNSALHQLFGLESTDDGDENPINSLTGQPGSLAEEMEFSGSSQQYNLWIDTFEPNTDGTELFRESGYGLVGVQSIGEFGQRTICFSYNLSNLNDGQPPSTRAHFVAQVTAFFGLNPGVMGDVNGDEVLNVLDIVAIVNFVVGTETPTPMQLVIGDVNQDGVLNVLDIITILNIIIAE